MDASDFDAYGPRLAQDLERRFLSRDPHQADYEFFRFLSNETGLFADVGANYGISVASFRLFNRRMRIVSFEPLPWMEAPMQLLKEREGCLFDYHMIALGSRDGEMTIEVPMVGDVPNFFRSSGRLGQFSDRAEQDKLRQSLGLAGEVRTVPVTVPVSRLDNFDIHPSIIKIDVEGLELDVLLGGWQTIKRHRPVVFLELSRNTDEILDMMTAADYGAYVYREGKLHAHDLRDRPINVIFLPPGRLP